MWHPPGKKRWPPSGQAQAATEYNHAVLGKPTLPGWRARRTTRAHTARSRTEPPTARRSPVQRHPRGLETRCAVFPDSHAAAAPKVHGRRIPHIGCEHFQLGTQDFTGDKQCFHTIPNVAVKKCRAFAQCGFTGQSPKIPYKGQERAHKGSVSTAAPPQHECSPRRRGAAASFRMRLSLQEAENRFPSRKGR